MFGTFLDKATGWLSPRLITSITLPVLAYGGGVLALVAAHLGWSSIGSWWTKLNGFSQVLIISSAIAFLLVVSWLTETILPAIIRLNEGYGWPKRLEACGVRTIDRRRGKLDLNDAQDDAARYREFPPAGYPVRPTRIGTVFRSAERYPESRYGLDAVLFWPRLYGLLPEALQASLSAARASLEQMLTISSLSVLFAITSAALAKPLHLSLVVWIPCLAGGLILGILAHRAAVTVAVGYAELIRASFDTHRRSLLQVMGVKQPSSLEEEKDLWDQLQQLIFRGASSKPIEFSSAGEQNTDSRK